MIYILLICFAAILIYVAYKKRPNIIMDREHILITGGSSGIGLAFAIEAVKLGASVTLLARNKEKLDLARNEVLQHAKQSDQKISVLAIDITTDFAAIENAVQQIEEKDGPITFLVNCAGASVSYRFEDTPLDDFQKMLSINYLGSVYLVRAVLPSMKSRKNGRIIFVSSLAGLTGLYGYTSYSASKFALRGLAEALQMEVTPYNISITVCFPPDTDTPGFAEEMKTKPLETQRLCESGGLYKAQDVSVKMLQDSMNNCFMSTIGLEGWIICNLCSGTSPVSSFTELLVQLCTLGVLRLVAAFHLFGCDKTIRQCALERESIKKIK